MFSGKKEISAIESTTVIFFWKFQHEEALEMKNSLPFRPTPRHFWGTNNADKLTQTSKAWSGVLTLNFCYQNMSQT